MNLKRPTEVEARLVHVLQVDLDSLTPAELEAHIAEIRNLRAVPSARTSAKKSSAKHAKSKDKFDENDLL